MAQLLTSVKTFVTVLSTMPCGTVDTIASVFTAIGTVSVAILAIWGDQIKDRLFGPRIDLSLVSPKGNLTLRGSGIRVYFYHLRVKNRPGRNAAKAVRVLLRGVSRRVPSGEFVQEPLVYPIQMVWTPMELREAERTIIDESTCDLGYLGQNDDRFSPSVMLTPNNFRGQVERDSCLRFEFLASGQNILSSKAVVFEVSWDGHWTENQEEMQRHLVIRKVANL
jgi:hypothetical protein